MTVPFDPRWVALDASEALNAMASICPTCEGGGIVPAITGTGAHTEVTCPTCGGPDRALDDGQRDEGGA